MRGSFTSAEISLSTCMSSGGRKGNECRGGLHYRVTLIRKMATNTQNQSEQQGTGPSFGLTDGEEKGAAQV